MISSLSELALRALLLHIIDKVRIGLPDAPANVSKANAFYNKDQKTFDELTGRIDELRSDFNELVAISSNSQTRIGLKERYKLAYKTAKKHKIGDCGEMAAGVFTKLRKRKINYVDLATVDNINFAGNHSFVVVGITDKWEKLKISDFPSNAIIVDPWMISYDKLDGKQSNGLYEPKHFSGKIHEISANCFSKDFDLAVNHLRLEENGEAK